MDNAFISAACLDRGKLFDGILRAPEVRMLPMVLRDPIWPAHGNELRYLKLGIRQAGSQIAALLTG